MPADFRSGKTPGNVRILAIFRGFPTFFRPKRRLADSDSKVFRSAHIRKAKRSEQGVIMRKGPSPALIKTKAASKLFSKWCEAISAYGVLWGNRQYFVYLQFLRRIRRTCALIWKSERHEGRNFERTPKKKVPSGFEPLNDGFADHALRPLGYSTRRSKPTCVKMESIGGNQWKRQKRHQADSLLINKYIEIL